jgi:hypothetical protein
MDSLYYFLPLTAVIALVASGTRNEAFEDIFRGALRIFLYLVAGTFLFALVLYVALGIPLLFYALLGGLATLLAYYTLKEIAVWLGAGGSKPDGDGD